MASSEAGNTLHTVLFEHESLLRVSSSDSNTQPTQRTLNWISLNNGNKLGRAMDGGRCQYTTIERSYRNGNSM
jgi:hypothetical protein